LRECFYYRKTEESVKKKSLARKTRYYPSCISAPLFFLYFFNHFFSSYSTIYDISLYIRALLFYISILYILFFIPRKYITFNIYNLYLSVLWSASSISWLTWHNFGYQTGITRAIAVAPVRTILNRRVGLGSVSVGRRSVGSVCR